jgi:phage tail protein X
MGDMWDSISFNVYGTSIYAPVLMNANPTVANTTVFNAGVVLTIPVVNATINVSMVPWGTISLK